MMFDLNNNMNYNNNFFNACKMSDKNILGILRVY